jgi:hypothetical protein
MKWTPSPRVSPDTPYHILNMTPLFPGSITTMLGRRTNIRKRKITSKGRYLRKGERSRLDLEAVSVGPLRLLSRLLRYRATKKPIEAINNIMNIALAIIVISDDLLLHLYYNTIRVNCQSKLSQIMRYLSSQLPFGDKALHTIHNHHTYRRCNRLAHPSSEPDRYILGRIYRRKCIYPHLSRLS